jgi:hypothetical protein
MVKPDAFLPFSPMQKRTGLMGNLVRPQILLFAADSIAAKDVVTAVFER